MLALRSRVGEAQRRAASAAVARILQARVWPRDGRWALYADLRDEVSMRPLFEAIRDRGLVPLLPRIRGERLEFAPVRSWSDLRVGALGVLQPPSGVWGRDPGPGDVVVLPGLAFDLAGFRLGRGGGFYDHSFGSAQATPLLIGVGYSFQLHARVPHGSRDRRVDAIVTERGMIWPGRRR